MRTIKINQPTVGILTSAGQKSPITGNFELFRFLASELEKKGRTVILLTPESLVAGQLQYGFLYTNENKGWMKLERPPLPPVIYNRIPYRKDERTDRYHEFIQWCNKHAIKLFNPGFFTKWDIYNALKQEPLLLHNLPYTEKLFSAKQLQRLLQHFPTLFLKPNDGSKGNGIFVLSKTIDGIIVKGQKETKLYESVNQLWSRVTQQTYIIQESIPALTYNGRKFDFRLWAHKVSNTWELSGIGIRQSKQDGITTHVLKGGNTLKFEEVSTPNDELELSKLTALCGEQLEKTYGNVKEFSMDVGKTNEGSFFIFEINAKPMKFDEPHIYKQGLQNLVKIFLKG